MHDRVKAACFALGPLLLGIMLGAGCVPTPSEEGADGDAPEKSLPEACLDSCTERVRCGQSSEICADVCESVQRTYQGACATAAAAAFECEASLSCAEIQDYLEDYRGSECRRSYASFAEKCGYQPLPPDQCEAFCARAEQCAPDLAVGGCADNCNITLGSLRSQYGSSCGATYARVFDCYRRIECQAMEALLLGQAEPTACAGELDAAEAACR